MLGYELTSVYMRNLRAAIKKSSRTLMVIGRPVEGLEQSTGLTTLAERTCLAFAPLPALASHHFEIVENGRSYWVAKDKEGLIGGVFRTQKDAFRFALFEVARNSACVRVLPEKPRRPRIT